MKVVILCGGRGSRLMEETHTIPKPMVSVGKKPILMHIMEIYSRFGFTEFVLALGYKAHIIKEFFYNYHILNSDFSVELASGRLEVNSSSRMNWKVHLVDTGLNVMTGGRLLRLKNLLGTESFMVTYGDGLANVNLTELVAFHKSHNRMATMTVVHPSSRFGEAEVQEGVVTEFAEKPQTNVGWINGGYFVFDPGIFKYLKGDSCVLEKDTLEKLTKYRQLAAYSHGGYWQCMDTLRDKVQLGEASKQEPPPWLDFELTAPDTFDNSPF